jgi:hypothetical protein
MRFLSSHGPRVRHAAGDPDGHRALGEPLDGFGARQISG